VISSSIHNVGENPTICAVSGKCCLHSLTDTPTEQQLLSNMNNNTNGDASKKFQFAMFSSFMQSSNDDTAHNAWSYTTGGSFVVRCSQYKKTKKKEVRICFVIFFTLQFFNNIKYLCFVGNLGFPRGTIGLCWC